MPEPVVQQTLQRAPPPPPSRLKVAATVLFHSTCAISVTLISKSALNGVELPVSLLALQTTVQVILLTAIGRPLGWIRFRRPLSVVPPQSHRPPLLSLLVLTWSPSQAWKAIFPLCCARLVGILAKTLCLAAVNASFYQIARGLLLPFTLLLSYLILRPRPTNPPLSLAGCAVIMLGFGTGMVTDIRKMLTSYKGLFLGVGSSFTTAVESVVVKKFLGKGDEGMWQLVWMSSTMQLALYAPILLLSGETDALAATTPAVFSQFVRAAVMTGFASFLLTLATFLQIAVTSPTTHMIVTAARGVAQSALAVIILGESVTAGRIWSMACILGGSTIYGVGKDRLRETKEAERGGYRAVASGEPDVELGEKK